MKAYAREFINRGVKVGACLSLWIKVPYTLFVAVLVPVYWVRYGPTNFLWFSDIALIGTLAALWLESSFLVSMMTTGVLLFDVVWSFLFFYRLIQGGRPVGFVGYCSIPGFLFSLGRCLCSTSCCR